MVTEASNTDFLSEIANGTVLVEVYTTWCQPCRQMKQNVLPEITSVKVLTVNAEENTHAMNIIQGQSGSIQGVPTLILYRDGQMVARHTGALNLEGVQKFIGDEE